MTTAPWAAVWTSSASEVSSGKPTTTPAATMASERACSRRRARRAGGQQVDGRQRRGDRRAPEGHEPRVEVGDGEPRGRQREREAEDAERCRARGPGGRARRRRAAALAVTGVAAIALSALLMLNDNAEARVIQDLRDGGRRALARRAPAVRARAHGPPPRLAGHRPARDRRAGRRGAARAAARPRHLRGAAPAGARRRPTSRGRRWRSAPAPSRRDALHELLAVPPPGAIPLSSGYLVARPAAARAASAPRWPARRAGPAPGSAARSKGARSCAPGSRARPAGACARTTWSSARAASPRWRPRSARSPRPATPCWSRRPTYLGAIVAARAAGLRVVPVPSDADGVRPDLLAQAFARTGARLVYCQPLYANPHGSVARRRPPRRGARRRRRRGRVPARGRLGARPEHGRPTRRRRWPPTIPTATSSTCAR